MTSEAKPKPAVVYVLLDPRTGQPRYVGCTNRTLERRLQDHLTQTTGARSTGELKDGWIKELLALGRKPIIKHHCDAPSLKDAVEIEEKLIAQMRQHGANLVNIGPGKYIRKKNEDGSEEVEEED
jgi:hypothetical protein